MLVMQKEATPLYRIMACLSDVKKRSARIEACFGPLQDTVRLLAPAQSPIARKCSLICFFVPLFSPA